MQLQSSPANQPKPVTEERLEIQDNASPKKNKMKEKEWFPNLQLSLSHNFDSSNEKKVHESASEINTLLSLSLSPSSSKQQAQPSEKHRDIVETKTWSLQTNCSNAALRLST